MKRLRRSEISAFSVFAVIVALAHLVNALVQWSRSRPEQAVASLGLMLLALLLAGMFAWKPRHTRGTEHQDSTILNRE